MSLSRAILATVLMSVATVVSAVESMGTVRAVDCKPMLDGLFECSILIVPEEESNWDYITVITDYDVQLGDVVMLSSNEEDLE